MENPQQKVAIIGAGISGITCAYLLQEKYQVTIFEKSNRIGGNAFSWQTSTGAWADISVTVFSKTYRKFFEIIDSLGVETAGLGSYTAAFHDMDSQKGIYMTPTLKGLKAQNFALFRPSMIKEAFMALRIIRKMISKEHKPYAEGQCFNDYLARFPEISDLIRTVLLSTICCTTSMSCDEVLASPASFMVHKMTVLSDFFSLKYNFVARKLKDSVSRDYFEMMSKGFKDRIILEADIVQIERAANQVTLTLKDGQKQTFDKVVFACHADRILPMLKDPSPKEQALLGTWRYNESRIVVHQDVSIFPERNLLGGFIYMYRRRGESLDLSVNGALWTLKESLKNTNYLATQYPNYPIEDKLIEFISPPLRTPIFSKESYATITAIPELNGLQNSYYCGNHLGCGLHEDAVSSAWNVARMLGAV